MTQKELISQIKEARKEFLDKDPCKYCTGSGCDDCRSCEDASLRHELTSKIFKLKKEFKKLYSEHPLNKEDILLLYKDLCGRTTYGTKIKWGHESIFTFDDSHCGIGLIDIETSPKIILSGCYYGDNIKPYLFPLSSMTEEQLDEYTKLCTEDTAGGIYYFSPDSIDWLNKHHFDWRGLIEKGLALDATNLNIY